METEDVSLSFSETLSIRSVCCIRMLSNSSTSQVDLKQAVGTVLQMSFGIIPDRHDRLRLARNVSKNMNERTWFSAKFGVRFIQNALDADGACSRRRYGWSIERNRDNARSVRDYLPHDEDSDSVVWDLRNTTADIVLTVPECAAQEIRKTISECGKANVQETLKELDYQKKQKVVSTDAIYIFFDKDEHHGVSALSDCIPYSGP